MLEIIFFGVSQPSVGFGLQIAGVGDQNFVCRELSVSGG